VAATSGLSYRTATLAPPPRYRSTTGALLIWTDSFHRLPDIERDANPSGSAEGAKEMIAAAFISFAILVVAWFVAPSRAHAAE
jgi:hypothetical protein